jgi:hypothetical protein
MNQIQHLTLPNVDFPGMGQLSPQLANAFSQLPSTTSSRIVLLVKKALPLGIDLNLIVLYAFLYVMAEQQAQTDAGSKDHAIRSRAELAGELHGLRTGYWDNTEAKQRYRRGRRARQQIAASLEGSLNGLKKTERIIRNYRSELPLHLQPFFSDERLAALRQLITEMHKVTYQDEEDVLRQTCHGRELSVTAQTYIWWHFAMAPYRRKWHDMHRLAVAWRLSPATHVWNFRTVVDRQCKSVALMRYPFGSTWESIFSKKF